MIVPFGKHKSKRLRGIPDNYLCWVLDTCKDISPTLRIAIEQQLCIVDGPPTARGQNFSICTAIDGWYRKLSMEFHPDRRDGSHDAMIAVNRARELLLEMGGVEG